VITAFDPVKAADMGKKSQPTWVLFRDFLAPPQFRKPFPSFLGSPPQCEGELEFLYNAPWE
jgi:hypothetical protein